MASRRQNSRSVHKLWNSILPQWKQLGWPRWDINLSWKGPYSGKMRTKIGWVFFAHHKNLIMGEGGRIAAPVHKLWNSILPQWKQLGWPRWDINLSWKGPYSGKMRTKIGWVFFAHHKNLIMGEGGRIAAPVHKLLFLKIHFFTMESVINIVVYYSLM